MTVIRNHSPPLQRDHTVFVYDSTVLKFYFSVNVSEIPIVDISGVRRIPDIQGFMDVPPELLRAARSALGLSQKDVAKLSRTSPRTVHRIEQNDNVRLDTLRQVQEAFETLGVSFLPATEACGPGIRIPRESIARKDLRF